ncbi:MAG: 2-phospho-L-lactate transferase CofD family protein [bacterium]
MPQKIKLTTIGGGSGHGMLLSALRDIENLDISAVVAMSDNGRSNGKLREELGILPVADILKCIIALSPKREMVKDFLLKKFTLDGRLNGYNAGYMMMAKLALFDNFENAVLALSEILEIKGRVFSVTLTRTTLMTEFEDGSLLYGEFALDKPCGFYGENKKIVRNFLIPHHGENITAYPPVIERIKNADYIIIGPGGFYNSVMVNFLLPEVKDVVSHTKAKLIFICNAFNRFGTEKFTLRNYIEELEKRIERRVDIAIANNGFGEKWDGDFVKADAEDGYGGRKIIYENLLDEDGNYLENEGEILAGILGNCIM